MKIMRDYLYEKIKNNGFSKEQLQKLYMEGLKKLETSKDLTFNEAKELSETIKNML